jgi:hypothetical protein
MDSFANLVGPIDCTVEELGTHTTTLRAVVHFDLNCFRFRLLLWREAPHQALRLSTMKSLVLQESPKPKNKAPLSSFTMPQGIALSA